MGERAKGLFIAVGLAGFLALSGSASASVTVGASSLTGDPNQSCGAADGLPCNFVSVNKPSGLPDPGSPIAGVMTTVTMRTTGGAATIKVRPVAQHPMVALTFLNIGPEVSLPVTADGSAAGHLTSATGLHVRIGIGNRLGLGHVSATPEPELGVTNGASSCGYLQGAGNEHPVGTEKPYTSDGSCARELLLQGVVEPDSDGDGFGDETQDLCPTNAAIQVACPVSVTPAAGAKKKCKKKKRKDSAEAAKRKCKRKKK